MCLFAREFASFSRPDIQLEDACFFELFSADGFMVEVIWGAGLGNILGYASLGAGWISPGGFFDGDSIFGVFSGGRCTG